MFIMRLAAEALSVKATSQASYNSPTSQGTPSRSSEEAASLGGEPRNLLHSLLTQDSVSSMQHSSDLFNSTADGSTSDWRRRANSLSLPRDKLRLTTGSSSFRPRCSTLLNGSHQRHIPSSRTSSRHSPYPKTTSQDTSRCSNAPLDLTAHSSSSQLDNSASSSSSASSLLKNALTGKSLEPNVNLFFQASSSHAPASTFSTTLSTNQRPSISVITPSSSSAFSIPVLPRGSTSNSSNLATISSSSVRRPLQSHRTSESIVERMLTESEQSYKPPTSIPLILPSLHVSLPPTAPSTDTAGVRLAKRNLFPIQSRVSEWLKQIGEFVVRTSPSFLLLSEQVQVAHLSRIWHRLLILFMIEANFSFVTTSAEHSSISTSTEDCQDNSAQRGEGQPHNSPTVSDPLSSEPSTGFVHDLRDIIQDGCQLHLDDKAMDLVKLSFLAQFGYSSFCKTHYNDVMSQLRHQLRDGSTFIQVLILLNKLSRFEPDTMRQLFCTHLPSDMSVEAAIVSAIES